MRGARGLERVHITWPRARAYHVVQVEVGPQLAALEAKWVNGVKKNLEIEGSLAAIDADCADHRKQLGVHATTTSG